MLIRKTDRGVYHVAPGADFPAYSTGLGLLETRLLRLYDTRCSVHFARPPSILWTSFAPDVHEPCHSCQISPHQPWRRPRLCPQSLPQLDPESYSKFIVRTLVMYFLCYRLVLCPIIMTLSLTLKYSTDVLILSFFSQEWNPAWCNFAQDWGSSTPFLKM